MLFCSEVKMLPHAMAIAAAKTACAHNPANAVAAEQLAGTGVILPPQRIALLVSKYWGVGGVKLGVGFMEQISQDLAQRILSHMNAWGQYCNVQFSLSHSPEVRISREQGGYWSYLGTDILHIPHNQQTMNLEGFTMSTPESEYHRVVRHETGHTLGFPHEHMRLELVQRLNPSKTVAYFAQTQGWSQQETIQQVLTPLDESSLRATAHADQSSIMCYQLPGSITLDGKPIEGGSDIDSLDQSFAASIYPPVVQPPQPPTKPDPPPNPNGGSVNPASVLTWLKVFLTTPLGQTVLAFLFKEAGTLGVPSAILDLVKMILAASPQNEAQCEAAMKTWVSQKGIVAQRSVV